MSALSTCSCCKGLEALTPAEIANAPALHAIAYRTGVWATFRETMLAALATRAPALESLDPYAGDDFATALIDAWAVACDVLSFYEERVANESYLRTATERRSLLELARAIGYELGPGVAASAWLAFTIEEPPPLALTPPPGSVIGAPQRVSHIPIRTKVQSVPGPDEKAQMFETVEAIDGYPEWNSMRPRRRRPPRANVHVTPGRVDLKSGDRVLIDATTIAFIANVAYQPADDVTIFTTGAVAAETGADDRSADPTPIAGSTVDDASLPQATAAARISGGVWRTEEIVALAALRGWDLDTLAVLIAEAPFASTLPGVTMFRQRAAAFGNNAPDWNVLPATIQTHYTKWDENTTLPNQNYLDLDGRYPAIVANSSILVEDGTTRQVYGVTSTTEVTANGFTLTARVTRLYLTDTVAHPLNVFKMRSTAISVESAALPMRDEPLQSSVRGAQVMLEGVFLRLHKGQRVVVSGRRDDAPSIQVSEVRELAEVTLDHRLTHVRFTEPLTHRYERLTVAVNANVAAATHGETTSEILGSGDASQSYQSFPLRQSPLTYVRAAGAPRGAASTLEVYVNDVRWKEVPSLHGHGPNERIYSTRIADDGTVTIRFGDGLTGARLPTGEQNVHADYRKGIGLEGLVRTDQLSLLMDRPYGVRGVTNPVPSRDADRPESREDARANAPLTVLTLDRIVSLRDFEDFSRAFSGIAKARANSVEGNDRHAVFITVAGPGGLPVDTLPLTEELSRLGDPFVSFVVRTYRRVFFRVSADVSINADRIPEKVFAAIDATLRAKFSFDARTFGQPVTRGEIFAAIQSVPGVSSLIAQLLDPAGNPVDRLSAALPAHSGDDGAEILLLDPSPVALRRVP